MMAYLIMTTLWWLLPGTIPPSAASDACWDKWAVRNQTCGELAGPRPLAQQVCLHVVAWSCDQKGK